MHNTYLPPANKSIPISIPDQAQRRSSVTSSEFFNSTLDDEAYESVDSISTTSSRINTTTSSDYLEPATRSVGTSTTMENKGCKQFEQYEEITAAKQTSKKSALVVLVVFLILAAFGVGFGVCVALKINTRAVPSFSAESEIVCPFDFIEISSSGRRHCYSIISKLMLWYESYNECISRNSKAHLLMVDDAYETNILRLPFETISVAEKQICTDGANRTWYWTAGQTTNPNTCNVGDKFYWKYLDSFGQVKNKTPITYENWESGEPSYGAQYKLWTWTTILIDGGPNSTLTYLKWGTNPIQTQDDPKFGRCGVCEIDMS